MHSRSPKLRKSRVLPSGLSKCPTGIHGLDEITVRGLPRGRPTLVCGGAGCGKTPLGIEFLVRGATQFDEAGVCLSFEETVDELTTNVASLGLDVAALIARKKLAIDRVYVERSLIEEAGECDLEALFVRHGQAGDSIGGKRVILDSVEALFAGLGNESVLRSELRRLFRWLKERNLTAIVTAERGGATIAQEQTEVWLLLRDIQSGGERNKGLFILKARGLAHSNQIREFLVTDHGVELREVYHDGTGLLTGSTRAMQEGKDASAALVARQKIERKQFLLERLVRQLPAPERKIIGGLSNTERVLVGLDLRPGTSGGRVKWPKSYDSTQAFEDAMAAQPGAPRYRLRLFVSGTTPRSARAIQNIRQLCEERPQGRYDLEVIDIYQHPESAEPEHIIVAPTLVKKPPLPFRKIIGDLSDKERVLAGLDLVPRNVAVHSPEEDRVG